MCGRVFSSETSGTALSRPVFGVLLECSDRQVRRIYASTVIAMMQNTLSFGYASIFEFPSNSVSHRRMSAVMESAISILVLDTHPNPTTIILFADFFPKALLDR
jgi:hypothetical protein